MDDYVAFVRHVSDNVKKIRAKSGKTVEEVAIEALGHSSTAFFNQAENYKNGKHFNLKHIYLLAKYFKCSVNDIIN